MIHAREDYNRIQDPAGLIPDDEPVFLIRGQDAAAIAAMNAWIAAAHQIGATDDILDLVKDHILLVQMYQMRHGKKVPDL